MFGWAHIVIGMGFLGASASPKAQPGDCCLCRKPSSKCDQRANAASENGVFVQVSRDGAILTSSDGISWARQPLPVRTFVRGVTSGQGVFVAVGGSYVDVPGVILTSHYGSNWIRRNPHTAMNLNSITYGDRLFVAVGDGGTIVISQDGLEWKQQNSGTSMALAAIAFGNGRLVAGGESGTILTSTNGVEWAPQCLGPSIYVGKILFRDQLFLVRDSDTAFISRDGLLWRRDRLQIVNTP